MARYVLDFTEIDQSRVALAGGKGAHLGELMRIDGVHVPAGFCVTTDAFQRILAEAPSVDDQLDRLSRLTADDHESIRLVTSEIRQTIESITIPKEIAREIEDALARLNPRAAYAVRSSATAEDSPTTSFAGQHDTYLNVVGPTAILQHVSRCWASLFSERAATYRLRNAVDHRKVRMAVVVQQMVFPRAAGILFTADPVTGNRKVSAVEASIGLGEALVSGLTNADAYKVRHDQIVAKTIATKRLAMRASSEGGIQQQAIDAEQQQQPALTDAQVVRLVELGRRIEAHFGRPQDIEWCLDGETFLIVQSRPITALFPIPKRDDDEVHLYLSVGHQQMMTDAMKPLGISVWQLSAGAPMFTAGGRLFVDVAQRLASPTSRAGILAMAWRSDPLTGDALQTILDRGDFITLLPDTGPGAPPPAATPIETDPAIVDELIARGESSIVALKRDIASKSGLELLDFIAADFQELKRILFDPRSHQAIMAGMEATWWINDRLQEWLGEKNAADTLSLSVPNNVTSEMGLALLDVADAIRPYPEVVSFLERVDDDDFLIRLPALAGGAEARDAICTWLDRYGMRGVGEIDITRPRWSEHPSTLLRLLLGNIKNFEPGAAARRFEEGRQKAWQKEQELLGRLRTLADGEQKALETKRMIDRVRTFIGYREYPKYGMISRQFVYKQALLDEAARLVRTNVLRERDDIFYLTFQELHDVVRTNQVDEGLIRTRRDDFQSYRALTPPRVLTSDGEIITGAYRREELPRGALVGLPVSAGIVEGRARVILDLQDATLEPGDVLVTTFTDPS